MGKSIEESQDTEQGKEPSIKTSNKILHIHIYNLNNILRKKKLTGIILILLVFQGVVFQKRKRTSDLEGPENQFLANPTNDVGNEFSTLQNGNQFASNPPGDQFPTLRDVEELDGQMPMAASPLSLNSEMTDGNFVPQLPNSLAQL